MGCNHPKIMSVHKSRKPFNNIPTQISTEENAAPKRKTTSLLYPKDLFISYCAGDIHKCYKFGKVLGKGTLIYKAHTEKYQ